MSDTVCHLQSICNDARLAAATSLYDCEFDIAFIVHLSCLLLSYIHMMLKRAQVLCRSCLFPAHSHALVEELLRKPYVTMATIRVK